MTEDERRLEISLRLKAARQLAGRRRGGRASPLSAEELAAHEALIDEGIGPYRIEDIEQMKTTALRRDLDAFVKALQLPKDWFAGLYPADSGRDVSETLGAALQRVTEGARVLHREREAPDATQRARGRRARGAEDDGA